MQPSRRTGGLQVVFVAHFGGHNGWLAEGVRKGTLLAYFAVYAAGGEHGYEKGIATVFHNVEGEQFMAEVQGYTTHLQGLLDRWGRGDETAIDEIIVHSQDRLRRMAARMLAAKPQVGRWNQTDDVLQNALLRLHRALKAVKPDSKSAFNGLAATQIRRELIDMARQLYGPEGQGRHYKSDPGIADSQGDQRPRYEAADPATDVVDQFEMAEFHESVGKLPDIERDVFELIFYQGMSQAEVAGLQGVSERTIKRRWRDARLALQAMIGEDVST